MRERKASDAGVYTLRVGDDHGPELSVRVDCQSKEKSLIHFLVSRVRGLVGRGSREDHLSERTLVVGGGVAFVAGAYFVIRSLFPWSDSDGLSQAFAENVKEWVYKCSSACSATPASLMSTFSRQ